VDVNAPDLLAIEADRSRRVKRDKPAPKGRAIAACSGFL
jgi:hypothetical protein